MAKLRLFIYAATAFAGIVWPWYCIYQFIQETKSLGLTDPFEIVELFSEGVWVNASSGFIAADLTLVLIAAFALIAAEAMRLKMKYWYLYFVATFAISFAFSFMFLSFPSFKVLLHINYKIMLCKYTFVQAY